MDSKVNEHLKKTSAWKRILFMMFFAVIIGFVRMLLWMIVFFQVISTLFLGSTNPNALKFGKVLSVYLYQILLFLTYNSEEIPFPFAEWGKTSVEIESN